MTDNRRRTDKGIYFSGFRDMSKILVVFLLGIIAYFLQGMDARFQKMEKSINGLQVTSAETKIEVHWIKKKIK